jgi:hypothetical protein
MAQNRQRRRRKHRGTQGGSIDTGRRGGGRPRTRAEARDRARSQMKSGKKSKNRRRQPQDRRDRPPSWRSAVNRALVGAGIFAVLLILPFHQPVGASLGIAALMLGAYIPMGYYIDRFMYNRRQAQKARAAQERRS